MLKLISILIFIVIVFFGLFHSSQIKENFISGDSKYNKLMGSINENADQPFDISDFERNMREVREDSDRGMNTINRIVASGELEEIQRQNPQLDLASVKNYGFDQYSANIHTVNYSSKELYAILTNVIKSNKPNHKISEFKNILSSILSTCCKLLEKEHEDNIHIDSQYLDKCISTSNSLSDIGKLHKIINRTYMYITDPNNNSTLSLYPVFVSEFNTQIPKLMEKGREIVFEISNKCYCYGDEKLKRFLRDMRRKQKYIENLQKEANRIEIDLRKVNDEVKKIKGNIYSKHNKIAQIKNIMRQPVTDRKHHCWIERRRWWFGYRNYRRCRWYPYRRRRNRREIQHLERLIDGIKREIKNLDSQINNHINKRNTLSNKIKQKYSIISTTNNEISVLDGKIAEERRKLREPCQPC